MSQDVQQIRRSNVTTPLMEKVAIPLLWLGIGYMLGRLQKPKSAGV